MYRTVVQWRTWLWFHVLPRISLRWSIVSIRLASKGRLFGGQDARRVALLMRQGHVGSQQISATAFKMYVIARLWLNEHQQPHGLPVDSLAFDNYQVLKRCLKDSPLHRDSWDEPAMRYNWVWWSLVLEDGSSVVRQYSYLLKTLGFITAEQCRANDVDDFWRYLDHYQAFVETTAPDHTAV